MHPTDLQAQCHSVAGGRPALAISLAHIKKAVDAFGSKLAGDFPKKPHSFMRNARLPVYGLAYSGFVSTLEFSTKNGSPKLRIELCATVHPFKEPLKIIATYRFTIEDPLDLFLSYSEPNRELRWASQSSPSATVLPTFTNEAETILQELKVPEPILDNYKRNVETIIIWTTSPSVAQLVVNAIPPIDIGEMAPWLTLLDPLTINFGERYLVVTAERSLMTIGACSPVDVVVEADPDFLNQTEAPVEVRKSSAVAAVYLPKSRLVEFVSRNVMPAVMFDSGERGGIIKWRMNGAFGFKEFIVEISSGIQVGNPWSGNVTLSGNLFTSSEVALTGVARAWIDGPCGAKVGLASASMQGNGRFKANIEITYRSPGGSGTPDYGATLEARLVVTNSDITPRVGIDALGWPIDEILDELVDHLAEKEIHELSGAARKLGKWDMASVPSWLVGLLGNDKRFGPVIETLSGISAVIGIAEKKQEG